MNNSVEHPLHYQTGGRECIDYIDDCGWTEGFCLGNAIKYITRAGKKDPEAFKEDLGKAIFCLNYAITHHGDDF